MTHGLFCKLQRALTNIQAGDSGEGIRLRLLVIKHRFGNQLPILRSDIRSHMLCEHLAPSTTFRTCREFCDICAESVGGAHALPE